KLLAQTASQRPFAAAGLPPEGVWLLGAGSSSGCCTGKDQRGGGKAQACIGEPGSVATILALIWLHGFKMDAQEEWELLAMKAVSWLRAQKASCVMECVEAVNALLGCNVQKNVLGL
ncbi:von Willebrand factor A domain-containing protein 5A-like, partial [Anoplopoma fimbria]|uniref:von Willebrand factor A domain-containing protein 5A-like n=1 Tax=Anoplopoma fimbria TaxID=229290 RepID=UPI0023EAD7CA